MGHIKDLGATGATLEVGVLLMGGEEATFYSYPVTVIKCGVA